MLAVWGGGRQYTVSGGGVVGGVPVGSTKHVSVVVGFRLSGWYEGVLAMNKNEGVEYSRQ